MNSNPLHHPFLDPHLLLLPHPLPLALVVVAELNIDLVILLMVPLNRTDRCLFWNKECTFLVSSGLPLLL